MDEEAEIMAVDEVADYLQVNRITVYRMIRQAKLRSFRVGRIWRFPRREIASQNKGTLCREIAG